MPCSSEHFRPAFVAISKLYQFDIKAGLPEVIPVLFKEDCFLLRLRAVNDSEGGGKPCQWLLKVT